MWNKLYFYLLYSGKSISYYTLKGSVLHDFGTNSSQVGWLLNRFIYCWIQGNGRNSLSGIHILRQWDVRVSHQPDGGDRTLMESLGQRLFKCLPSS